MNDRIDNDASHRNPTVRSTMGPPSNVGGSADCPRLWLAGLMPPVLSRTAASVQSIPSPQGWSTAKTAEWGFERAFKFAGGGCQVEWTAAAVYPVH